MIIREDRVKDYIFPVRIIKSSGNITGVENLLKEKDLQISLVEPYMTHIKGDCWVILDFGKELFGGIRVLAKTPHEQVRIRFGESVMECCAPLHGEKNATNDHSVRDMNVVFAPHSDCEYGQTGFRFVRLDFTGNTECDIKSIVASFIYRDLEYKGDFQCDDQVINDIYKTARRTCHLCMQNMLWDGIKRDKLVWVGDTHPEMLTIRSAFGDDRCIFDVLEFSLKKYTLPQFMNRKPSYSMWFVIILYGWYMQNKHNERTEKLLNYVDELFNTLEKDVNEDGTIDLCEYFLDWPTKNADEGEIGVKSLFIIALDCAIKLYGYFNRNSDKLIRLKKILLKQPPENGKMKQVTAFSILSGERTGKSKESAVNDLLKGGARGMSTFMSYYILRAIAENGHTAEALEMMKEYYNGMLLKGATSFWEDFDVDWMQDSGRIDEMPEENQKDIHGDYGRFCYKGFRHSLCHGWSSGPVPFLTEYIMGVKILEPGCKKISIKPNLGRLEFVNGRYPVPDGIIEIEAKVIDGKTYTTITAPKSVKVVSDEAKIIYI